MTNNSTSSAYVSPFKSSTETWIAAFLTTSFLVVLLNLVTILTFVVNRHLRRPTVYCLINLAVADLLYGFSIMTGQLLRVISENLRINENEFTGMALTMLFNMTLFTTLFSLVVVSLERVYAIFFPFRHRTTRIRTYLLVFLITWLLPSPILFTFTFLPGDDNRYFNHLVTMVSVFLFCLIVIFLSYAAIFINIKVIGRRLQLNLHETTMRNLQKREQYLAVTIFIVTVLSLLTWLPYIVLHFCVLLGSKITSYGAVKLVFLIQLTNSLINPVIYVFRIKDFKKALIKLVFKCSRDQQSTQPIGQHGEYRIEHEPAVELHAV